MPSNKNIKLIEDENKLELENEKNLLKACKKLLNKNVYDQLKEFEGLYKDYLTLNGQFSIQSPNAQIIFHNTANTLVNNIKESTKGKLSNLPALFAASRTTDLEHNKQQLEKLNDILRVLTCFWTELPKADSTTKNTLLNNLSETLNTLSQTLIESIGGDKNKSAENKLTALIDIGKTHLSFLANKPILQDAQKTIAENFSTEYVSILTEYLASKKGDFDFIVKSYDKITVFNTLEPALAENQNEALFNIWIMDYTEQLDALDNNNIEILIKTLNTHHAKFITKIRDESHVTTINQTFSKKLQANLNDYVAQLAQKKDIDDILNASEFLAKNLSKEVQEALSENLDNNQIEEYNTSVKNIITTYASAQNYQESKNNIENLVKLSQSFLFELLPNAELTEQLNNAFKKNVSFINKNHPENLIETFEYFEGLNLQRLFGDEEQTTTFFHYLNTSDKPKLQDILITQIKNSFEEHLKVKPNLSFIDLFAYAKETTTQLSALIDIELSTLQINTPDIVIKTYATQKIEKLKTTVAKEAISKLVILFNELNSDDAKQLGVGANVVLKIQMSIITEIKKAIQRLDSTSTDSESIKESALFLLGQKDEILGALKDQAQNAIDTLTNKLVMQLVNTNDFDGLTTIISERPEVLLQKVITDQVLQNLQKDKRTENMQLNFNLKTKKDLLSLLVYHEKLGLTNIDEDLVKKLLENCSTKIENMLEKHDSSIALNTTDWEQLRQNDYKMQYTDSGESSESSDSSDSELESEEEKEKEKEKEKEIEKLIEEEEEEKEVPEPKIIFLQPNNNDNNNIPTLVAEEKFGDAIIEKPDSIRDALLDQTAHKADPEKKQTILKNYTTHVSDLKDLDDAKALVEWIEGTGKEKTINNSLLILHNRKTKSSLRRQQWRGKPCSHTWERMMQLLQNKIALLHVRESSSKETDLNSVLEDFMEHYTKDVGILKKKTNAYTQHHLFYKGGKNKQKSMKKLNQEISKQKTNLSKRK